jgi:hypothetical protein
MKKQHSRACTIFKNYPQCFMLEHEIGLLNLHDDSSEDEKLVKAKRRNRQQQLEEPHPAPVRLLRVAPVGYVDALETLTGVSDRPLEGWLVPQKVLGVEASGRWVRPVLVFRCLFMYLLLPDLAPVKGEVRGTFGPKANGP